MNKQSAIHISCGGEWLKLKSKPIVYADGFKRMREWQHEAFSVLKDAQYMILNAPMGSGKSLEMCDLSAYKLTKDRSLRCIIAVPQTDISKGVVGNSFCSSMQDHKIEWGTNNDLCINHIEQVKKEQLITFISTKQPYIDNYYHHRVLVCCHATLVNVYNELKAKGKLGLLKNLLIWIDEAHHIKNQEIEDFIKQSNEIGNIVDHLIKHKDRNLHVGLVTATFFRGDKLSLLSSKQQEQFTRFNLPYDRYLSNMQFMRSFSYDFMLCGDDPFEAIVQCVKGKQGKDIVYVPPSCARNGNDKLVYAERIISSYQKVLGGRRTDYANGLVVLKNKQGKDFKIINLVDETNRDSKKEYIKDVKSKDDLDLIIALNMFQEGSDWIYADREFIIGDRGSLTQIVQMFGRLFRDVEGKQHVQAIHLLPFRLNQYKDPEEFHESLNDFWKLIHASLILENAFSPAGVMRPPLQSKDQNEAGDRPQRVNLFNEAVPDLNKQTQIVSYLRKMLLTIVADFGIEDDPKLWYEQFERMAAAILPEYGITENVVEIGKQIYRLWASKSPLPKGYDDIRDVPFDILKQADVLHGLTAYICGECGLKTLQDLRTAINHQRKTIEEWVEVAERLVKDNGGILPTFTWIKEKGLGGLYHAMRNDPQSFHHINRAKAPVRKSITEWIAIAEQLAKDNGGQLPAMGWLNKNCGGLTYILRRYPDQFSHLIQESKKGKTAIEWVVVAERLAKENGGTLQFVGWIQDNHAGLAHALVKNPELFSHIPQERKMKTVIEWVKVAEELAKTHGGILPKKYWLACNGYSALKKMMQDHPKKFKHIKQEILVVKSVQDHVKEAERLAKNNNGLLPNDTKIACSLRSAMKRNPSDFSHIPQDKKVRSTKEWIETLENLANQHNGIIPNYKWFKDNDDISFYSSIRRFITHNPELTKHICMEEKQTRTIAEWMEIAQQLKDNNGGQLPTSVWLRDNKLGGLESAIARFPTKFVKQLRQVKVKKTVQEYVVQAEILAKKHKGLPDRFWLRSNGHDGVSRMLYRYPEKFKHIKRQHVS